jgi:hypothetical protein
MGFLLNNNYASNYLHLYYIIQQPKGIMMNTTTRLSTYYNTLYESSRFKCLIIEAANKTTYSNFWMTHIVLTTRPMGFHDFYEPRTWGFMYDQPDSYEVSAIVATDGRKPFYIKWTGEWMTVS